MDKVAVVTGGSSGIGRALGRAFGREGWTVWLGARREAELREAAREVDAAGGTGRYARLDVTDEASVAAFAEAVRAESGHAHALVNNAGVGGGGRAERTSLETWRRVLDTNLTGPFLVTKAFLPLLRKAEGRRFVVNVVSVAGKQAYAGGGTYAASKFGLRGWTEALALELAEDGIRVTAVMPGYVATPLVKGAAPADRMVQPDELAEQVVGLTKVPDSIHVDELTVWPWRMYTE
jgi:NAD(P)-dependent dehydrogenase (short-subunit alcohol dehydrogenase family)